MKIVDITEFYSERGGGIRTHLTNRGHFLCQLEQVHLLVAPGPKNEETVLCAGPRRGESRLVRLAGPRQPYDRTYHLLHRLDKVRQRVLAERPDVLEAHSPYLATAAVTACGPRSARLKTAFWHSDHLGVYVEGALARWLGVGAQRASSRILWLGVRALLAPFDATFAAGRLQADRLRAAGIPRVIHAPFGVDAGVFHPAPPSVEWRNQWLSGQPDDAALLVGVGRFATEKRWDVVLEAFARVRLHRNAVLVLLGDGPERSRLERNAPSGVHFGGFEMDRSRLATALASADLLVHASPYETFGLSIAEAVACGLPIVVPDAGAAAEHADPGCSAIYRSLDAAACAAGIETLLDRRRDELRAHASDVGRRARTAEQHFRQVLGAYDDLLEEIER
ncbi:MAG: glycosyltransferase [Polyangiaceae bacterium]